jgi:hypothetical protein
MSPSEIFCRKQIWKEVPCISRNDVVILRHHLTNMMKDGLSLISRLSGYNRVRNTTMKNECGENTLSMFNSIREVFISNFVQKRTCMFGSSDRSTNTHSNLYSSFHLPKDGQKLPKVMFFTTIIPQLIRTSLLILHECRTFPSEKISKYHHDQRVERSNVWSSGGRRSLSEGRLRDSVCRLYRPNRIIGETYLHTCTNKSKNLWFWFFGEEGNENKENKTKTKNPIMPCHACHVIHCSTRTKEEKQRWDAKYGMTEWQWCINDIYDLDPPDMIVGVIQTLMGPVC